METVQDYVARLLSHVDGKDPLQVLAETPAQLAALAGRLPSERLKRRPSPDKWSVLEIVAHLAEAEISLSWRYRQILESDGAPLHAYDQEAWARLGDYTNWSVNDGLEQFRLLRQANLNLFSRLTEEQWLRQGIHSERGPLTLRELVRHAAGHDRNHIEQIERILSV